MMTDTPALDKWRKEMSGRAPAAKVAEPPAGPLGTIYQSRRVRVPTPGSQRRCYNGCFPSSDWEMIWDEWETLETNTPSSRLDFWTNLGGETSRVRYKWEQNQ